jgi:hypothetical protein
LSFLHPIFICLVWKKLSMFCLFFIQFSFVGSLKTEHVFTFLHPIFISWVRKLSMFCLFFIQFSFLGSLKTEHVFTFLHPIFICWLWKTEHVLTFLHPIFICWVCWKLSMFSLFFIQFSFVWSGNWACFVFS